MPLKNRSSAMRLRFWKSSLPRRSLHWVRRFPVDAPKARVIRAFEAQYAKRGSINRYAASHSCGRILRYIQHPEHASVLAVSPILGKIFATTPALVAMPGPIGGGI